MRILFTIIGLVISVSLVGMLVALIGLLFVDRQPLRDVLNALFLVVTISTLTFIITLMVIPHGRIQY